MFNAINVQIMVMKRMFILVILVFGAEFLFSQELPPPKVDCDRGGNLLDYGSFEEFDDPNNPDYYHITALTDFRHPNHTSGSTYVGYYTAPTPDLYIDRKDVRYGSSFQRPYCDGQNILNPIAVHGQNYLGIAYSKLSSSDANLESFFLPINSSLNSEDTYRLSFSALSNGTTCYNGAFNIYLSKGKPCPVSSGDWESCGSFNIKKTFNYSSIQTGNWQNIETEFTLNANESDINYLVLVRESGSKYLFVDDFRLENISNPTGPLDVEMTTNINNQNSCGNERSFVEYRLKNLKGNTNYNAINLSATVSPDYTIISNEFFDANGNGKISPFDFPPNGELIYTLELEPKPSAYGKSHNVDLEVKAECLETINNTTTIFSNKEPTAFLSDQTICEGETITLSPTLSFPGQNTPTFLWSYTINGEHFISNNASITIRPLETTNLTFTYSYDNGCSTTITPTIHVNKITEENYPGKVMNGFEVRPGQAFTFDAQMGEKWIRGPIIVKSTGRLIFDAADIAFINDWELFASMGNEKTQPTSGIVVEPGGILIIRNGSILGAKPTPCSEQWDGIQIQGDDVSRFLTPFLGGGFEDLNPLPGTVDLPHPKKLLPFGFEIYRHGICYFQGNSRIYNADEAFSMYRRFYPNNDYDYGKGLLFTDPYGDGGGLIGECNKGVVFKADKKEENNSIIKNLSIATQVVGFLARGQWEDSNVGIELTNITDVIFENISLDMRSPKTTGFLVFNSSLNLNATNTLNSIWWAEMAIEAYSTGSLKDQFEINLRNTSIGNFKMGMYVSGFSYPHIRGSQFREGELNPEYSIFLDGVNGALVTENEFSLVTSKQPTYQDRGVLMRLSDGDINEVYLNNFNKPFGAAVQMQDGNPVVSIDCNTFEGESQYDIAVTSGAMANLGLCDAPFGEEATPVANSFINSCGGITSANVFAVDNISGFNYSANTIKLPNCVNNNISVIECSSNSPENGCNERPGIVRRPITDILTEGLISSGGNGNDVVRYLLTELEGEEVAKLLPLTSNLRLRTYIATMLDSKNIRESKKKLKAFKAQDNLTNDDVQFVELFSLLIALAEEDKSWNAMDSLQLNVVKNIALTSGHSALAARAVYGSVTGERIKTQPESIPQPVFALRKKEEPSNTYDFGLIDEGIIEVFPNPASELITIKLKNVKAKTVRVTNTLGQIVFEQNDGNLIVAPLNIKVRDWAKGAYSIYILKNNDEVIRKTLLVNAQ